MNQLTESIVTIFVGITSIAILAVLVSRRSNTSGVIKSLFGGYSQAVSVAVSPITGGGGSLVNPGMSMFNYELGGLGN